MSFIPDALGGLAKLPGAALGGVAGHLLFDRNKKSKPPLNPNAPGNRSTDTAPADPTRYGRGSQSLNV